MTDLLGVGEETFDAEVLDSDRPVLIDFWAEWCHPCHLITPHVEALSQELASSLKVVKVNVDENPSLAGRYGVMSIPTLLLLSQGVEKARVVGARSKEAIRAEIDSYL
ncbi:MAG: thioredoxin [Actinomycetota bacterium]